MLALDLTGSCPLGSCTDHVEHVRVFQEEGNRGGTITIWRSTTSANTKYPTDVHQELLRTHERRAGREL